MIFMGVRDKKYVRLQKIFLWGSQNKYLRHQKKICPWTP
jgi:hypothetical protein